MRFPLTLCATALAVGAFLAPAAAQVQIFGGVDPDRRASTVVMFGANFAAGASVSFSAPNWKDEYDGMLDQLKGKNARLGKNWWTSLDTSVALEIGTTKLEAGTYFLGLHVDNDGNFHLLVFDAKNAMKTGLMPFAPDRWTVETKAALKLNKDALKESSTKMQIVLSADASNPGAGKFAIHWGKHELMAPVKFHIPSGNGTKGAEDASGKKTEPKK
jgi:hypothetical protein